MGEVFSEPEMRVAYRVLFLFVLKTISGVSVGNQKCEAGLVLWAKDGQCYRLNTQGPCSENEVLVTSLTGFYCSKFENEDEDKKQSGDPSSSSIPTPSSTGKDTNVKDRWDLPIDDTTPLSNMEQACLVREQVYWPGDGHCYSLLSQGPCSAREWLVLSRHGDSVGVVCKHRPCPCDPAAKDLCEVELEEGPCKCKVALAAAQDGLCDVGEQLLVNPFGFGECGCITNPPHTSWPEDGRCYPVYSQGPCEPGFILKMNSTDDSTSLEPVCQPAVCKDGKVEYDGGCHYLGYQGPCQEVEILRLDSDTLEPACIPDTSKVKRVYDIIPKNKGFITNGPLLNTFKIKDCKRDSNGKCRRKRITI